MPLHRYLLEKLQNPDSCFYIISSFYTSRTIHRPWLLICVVVLSGKLSRSARPGGTNRRSASHGLRCVYSRGKQWNNDNVLLCRLGNNHCLRNYNSTTARGPVIQVIVSKTTKKGSSAVSIKVIERCFMGTYIAGAT